MEEVEQCNKLYMERYGINKESFFFEYDEEGKVTSIHLLIEELKKHFQCNFKGIDLLNLKASELIKAIDTIDPYIRDQEALRGFTYQFPDLGLTLWRGNVCTEEDLEADWFKELIPENQEDEKRFLFFETITFHHKEKVFQRFPETEINIEKNLTQRTTTYWEKEPDPDQLRELAIKFGLEIPKNLK
ncbi:hypothetical protein [Sporosarcina sp. ACRSL]|uniref:hypothetical protein n=1 Tax=Sporosarcina sp. ACRSL TaxID=2918215 RepID=UPI001EF6AAE0|nr:hypothetical protein [Sporosarcina sp. ACRSL]